MSCRWDNNWLVPLRKHGNTASYCISKLYRVNFIQYCIIQYLFIYHYTIQYCIMIGTILSFNINIVSHDICYDKQCFSNTIPCLIVIWYSITILYHLVQFCIMTWYCIMECLCFMILSIIIYSIMWKDIVS